MTRQRATLYENAEVHRHFGYKFLSRSETHAEVTLPLTSSYLQTEGVVHGGVISALADTAAVYMLYPDLPAGVAITSIEFKMNFVRPAVLDGGDVVARASLVKKGRKITLSEVELFQRDELVAKGLFTYLVYEKRA